MNKQDYHKLKKHLRNLSKPQLNDLCKVLELNDSDCNLLKSWYDGESVVKIAMNNFISDRTYTHHIKKIFFKIYNYYIYKNISF